VQPGEGSSNDDGDEQLDETQQNQRKLQFEAAWALTNIDSSDHTAVIVEAGAIPPLLSILATKLAPGSVSQAELIEQAVWCLGNIAGDGAALRDAVLVHGGLNALIKLIAPDNDSAGYRTTGLASQRGLTLAMRRNIVWALSNLCRNKPHPDAKKIRGIIPVLAKLLQGTDLTTS
jgi:importin subunit alpha-2